MKIDISKTQYKTLVKAVFLANWVINCHKTDEPDDEFERLEQYILAQGKFFDLRNVEFDEKHGKYYHDSDVELNMVKLLDDFVDVSFWHELTERLAERDFVNTLGEEAILKMSQDEHFTKFYEFVDPYEAEFAEHGLDNLVIRTEAKE